MEESVLIPKIDLGSSPQPQPELEVKPRVSKKTLQVIAVVLGILLLGIIIPAFFVYQSGQNLLVSSQKLATLADTGNLSAVKNEIPNVKKDLSRVRTSYFIFSWTRIIPFLGGYTKDLGHIIKAGDAGLDAFDIVVTTALPYADVLGYTSEVDGAKTTQERIDFIVKAIPDIIPKLDEISSKLKIVKTEIDEIDPERYPDKFKGKEIKKIIIKAQFFIDQGTDFVTEGKPLLEIAPYILGIDGPRKYLVLFQNDKELRPTGGFLTAYSVTKVENAKFEPVSSNDIYNLDAKYKPNIPAPDPIIAYIKGPYVLSKNWRLRDMNWSPDFEESMKLFSQEAKSVGIEEFDGIIGVDTQLLVNLLNAIGPIGVPGFGNFSTLVEPKCNCPQVIYELESFADTEGPIVWDPVSGKIVFTPPNYDNRKKIIGPLMNSVLANALGQPKEKLPALFGAAYKSVTEKHVLFYLFDEKVQKAVSDFGIAGKIEEYQGDYLHINDSNLGGRKSNLYVKHEVGQEIEIEKGGGIVKTITLTYNNPEKHDGWLNSVLPSWVRVYVPKGSELIEATGLEDKAQSYEDLGKTVFAGLYKLRPEGVVKVTFKYRLPMKFSKSYNILIQKQPGTDGPLYTINLGKFEEEFFLTTDKEIKIKI
ncbi:MAG: DUF4012 domain-containing protein [Patescibacteria group bacterium]